MRKIVWLLLLLALVCLAGCSSAAGSQGQPANSTPSPLPTQADANPGETVSPTPDPTVTVSVTPTPTPTLPTATPTPRPTIRPTPTSSGSTAGLIGTSQERQLGQQLFALINQDRANQGLFAYTLNGTLSSGAYEHSQRMAGCGMSHQCPGEPDPCQRVTNEGIAWTTCGENVGYTSPNPTSWAGVQKIEQYMLAEQPPDDGHRRNLLSTSFHRIGIGIFIDANSTVWITEDFTN